MTIYSDKLAHVQVVINCQYSLAQPRSMISISKRGFKPHPLWYQTSHIILELESCFYTIQPATDPESDAKSNQQL